MLVLNRNAGEKVRVGDSVEVMVVEVRGNRVKLGFKAPLDVVIMRDELVDDPGPPDVRGELVSADELDRLRRIEYLAGLLVSDPGARDGDAERQLRKEFGVR